MKSTVNQAQQIQLIKSTNEQKKSSYLIEPINSISQKITTQDQKHQTYVNNDETMTFITGLKAQNVSMDQKLQMSMNNFSGSESSYKKIHEELNACIGTLDEKMDGMIEKHEKDFMVAYRGHMLKIQKELEYLKRKVSEQEFMLRRDERISALEKQLEWFRSEALTLSKANQQYKAEAEQFKQKSETLEEERAFLQIQITKQKRQSKLLKMALGKTQENCSQLLQFTKDIKLGDSLTPTLTLRKSMEGGGGMIETQNSEAQTPNPLKNQAFHQWNDELVTYDVVKAILQQRQGATPDRLAYEISNTVDQKFDSMQSQVIKLKMKNESLDKELRKLRTQLSELGLSQNDLRRFFIDCIDTVKKDIERRKTNQQIKQPFSTTNKKISAASTGPIGNAQVGLESFQQQDKIKVIELLLSNDETLRILYQYIFQRKSQSENRSHSIMNMIDQHQQNQFLAGIQTERSNNNQIYNQSEMSTLKNAELMTTAPLSHNFDNLIRSKRMPNFEKIKSAKYQISLHPMTAKSGNRIGFQSSSGIPSNAQTRASSHLGGAIAQMKGANPRPMSTSYLGRKKRMKSNYTNILKASDYTMGITTELAADKSREIMIQ